MSKNEATVSRTSMYTKRLVVSAMAIALAFLTSWVKVFALPYGGSVTLFSMLFICLIGYWYGTVWGIITGFCYGILQFIQEPYFLNVIQVCCDYLLAFAGLGLAGVWSGKKNGLIKGYILGVIVRGLFHAIGGYMFWMSYMPDNFPKSLTIIYPIVYNYSYIGAEAIITIIVLMLPPVKSALERIKKTVV